jgi:hypothetical protein
MIKKLIMGFKDKEKLIKKAYYNRLEVSGRYG